VVTQRGVWDSHHASVFWNPLTKLSAIGKPQRAYVSRKEVGALGGDDAEPELRQIIGELIPLRGQTVAELFVVVVRKLQCFSDGPLKRSTGDVRQVLAHYSHCRDQLGGSDRPAHLPTSERKRLSRRPDRDSSFPHAREGGNRNVRMAVEPQVLVGLICQHDQIMFNGDFSNPP